MKKLEKINKFSSSFISDDIFFSWKFFRLIWIFVVAVVLLMKQLENFKKISWNEKNVDKDEWKEEDEKFIIEKIFIYICGEKEFGNG